MVAVRQSHRAVWPIISARAMGSRIADISVRCQTGGGRNGGGPVRDVRIGLAMRRIVCAAIGGKTLFVTGPAEKLKHMTAHAAIAGQPFTMLPHGAAQQSQQAESAKAATSVDIVIGTALPATGSAASDIMRARAKINRPIPITHPFEPIQCPADPAARQLTIARQGSQRRDRLRNGSLRLQ